MSIHTSFQFENYNSTIIYPFWHEMNQDEHAGLGFDINDFLCGSTLNLDFKSNFSIIISHRQLMDHFEKALHLLHFCRLFDTRIYLD